MVMIITNSILIKDAVLAKLLNHNKHSKCMKLELLNSSLQLYHVRMHMSFCFSLKIAYIYAIMTYGIRKYYCHKGILDT